MVKPLDYVKTPDGRGVVYSVSTELKQASVLMEDHKIHSYGLAFVKDIGSAEAMFLKKLHDEVAKLRKQVFG